jgi:hypothetical protein
VEKIKNYEELLAREMESDEVKAIIGRLAEAIYASMLPLTATTVTPTDITLPLDVDHTIGDIARRAYNIARKTVERIVGATIRSIGTCIRTGLDPRKYAALSSPQITRIAKQDEVMRALTLSDATQRAVRDIQAGKYLDERIRQYGQDMAVDIRSDVAMADAIDTGYTRKRNIDRGDDKVCDICLDNSAAGWIDIGGYFPSGDLLPQYHPNCRCSVEFE